MHKPAARPLTAFEKLVAGFLVTFCVAMGAVACAETDARWTAIDAAYAPK